VRIGARYGVHMVTMTPLLRRAAVLASSAAVAALLLAGCSAGAGSEAPVDDYAGLPKGVREPGPDLAPFASWQSDGERIALTLYGSSGCPPIGESMRVRSSNSLVVELETIDPNTACTADYAPHTTVFGTPSDVTTTSDVTILVGDETITLRGLR
jgi:hypothetical protein